MKTTHVLRIFLRVFAIALALDCGLSTLAAQQREITLATVTKPVAEAEIHVRTQTRIWELRWNVGDDANYVSAEVRQLSEGFENEYDYVSQVTVCNVVDGTPSTLVDKRVSHKTRDFSLRLCKYPGGEAVLQAGDGMFVASSAEMPQIGFEDVPGNKIILVEKNKPSKPYTHVSLWESAITDEVCDIDTTRLMNSADSLEGIWEFQDRRMPDGKVLMGGTLRLATVRHGDGYRIIYLSGEKINPQNWKTGMERGRLFPTVFFNHFDLRWITSDGASSLRQECWADFTLENNLLTLSFPLLKTELRFRRVFTPEPQKKSEKLANGHIGKFNAPETATLTPLNVSCTTVCPQFRWAMC